MTDGERRLWLELREFRRWYGVHVRRQVPIGRYVADFAIHEQRLVIEVDGEHHFEADRMAKDGHRDDWFGSQGYRVLRFNTGELSDSFEGCVEEILAALGLMRHEDTPTPNPSPQGGGGLGALSVPVIRPATVDDLRACATIINDYIDATEWLPRVKSREEIAGFFTPELLQKRTVLVADAGGEIAAYVSIADGWLYAIYVAPGHRGAGLGRLLLDHLKQRFPEKLELTVFEPNADARRFYEREGFHEVPEGRVDNTDEGIPVLLMRWRAAA